MTVTNTETTITESSDQTETGTPPDPAATTQTDPKPSRAATDAKKYRSQARAAETERDTLRDNLHTQSLAVIEQTATTPVAVEQKRLGHTSTRNMHLIDPTDLARYTDGGLDTYLTADGTADTTAVLQALQALAETRPYLFITPTRTPLPDPSQGHGTPVAPSTSFEDAFKPAGLKP